jgi:iron complex outermembrane receptor protein
VAGGHLLGRWQRQLGGDSNLHVRAYYDWTHRDDPSFEDDLQTIDLDVQHRFTAGDRHEFLWGLNLRSMSNRNIGAGVFALAPESSRDRLISGFVQDQIALAEGLELTLGTKWEHNDFSGTEWQPSVRGAWAVADGHTLWAAASRAARVPTRLERDVAIDVTDPTGDPIVRLLGNPEFGAEELRALELGYRWRATSSLHIDVAVFDHHYDDLGSLEVGDPFIDPSDGRTVIPIRNQNLTEGRAQGVETLVTFAPLPAWRLSVSHSYLHLRLDPAGQDINRGEFYEDATPRHQVVVGSYLTLSPRLQLDAHFRALSAIRRLPEEASGEGLPAYRELDVRFAWQAADDLQISLVGRNLLHPRHVEGGSAAARGGIERAVQVQVVWAR